MATTLSQSGVEADTSRPPSGKSSLGIVQFGFHAKTSFDADDALLQTRSEKLKVKKNTKDDDIWRKPPPDFRVAVYDPRPPKRNTIDSMQPWRYGTIPGERTRVKRERASLLPVIFRDNGQKEAKFVTRFHIPRPFTAKKQFVKDGMYPAKEYETPQRHDFRRYPPIKSLGLPEFLTDHEKDPYDIRFNTDHLNTIHGLTLGCVERDLVNDRQMAPAMPSQPKYESELVLSRDPWPTKSGAYTRHRRRNRQAYSAFMERVETELVTQWAREKLEKVLQEYEERRQTVKES
ncbi:uncharacterized protein LOC124135058 [Haliotis rufescens]|uniref:uncharacterized protein LOC124135058 n=1 Tax=Haliotis rufescens TaxID=6454 RepID=UPI00201EBF93|nr:uncharacterized protein LOC124135058 [Haliotis rufescens]